MVTKTLTIQGMHCPSCALLIEGELEDIGVNAKADYPKGIVTVKFDPAHQSEDIIHAAIQKAGYAIDEGERES
jgi:copper chaperone CopZ